MSANNARGLLKEDQNPSTLGITEESRSHYITGRGCQAHVYQPSGARTDRDEDIEPKVCQKEEAVPPSIIELDVERNEVLVANLPRDHNRVSSYITANSRAYDGLTLYSQYWHATVAFGLLRYPPASETNFPAH